MRYEDMTCGIRVRTPKGEGVVKSYTAKVPELRKHFDFLGNTDVPEVIVATFELDSGRTKDFPIKSLAKIEEAESLTFRSRIETEPAVTNTDDCDDEARTYPEGGE